MTIPDLNDAEPCEEPIFYTFRPENVGELKRYVEDAFADIVYPGDDDLSISPCPCGECTDVRDFFRGKHWRELIASGESLPVLWAGLSIMSPQAWLFFLPAYLILGLNGNDVAAEVMDSALFSVAPMPHATGHLIQWFKERAGSFTLAQQQCIAAYAQAASESDPDDEHYAATAAYWHHKATGT